MSTFRTLQLHRRTGAIQPLRGIKVHCWILLGFAGQIGHSPQHLPSTWTKPMIPLWMWGSLSQAVCHSGSVAFKIFQRLLRTLRLQLQCILWSFIFISVPNSRCTWTTISATAILIAVTQSQDHGTMLSCSNGESERERETYLNLLLASTENLNMSWHRDSTPNSPNSPNSQVPSTKVFASHSGFVDFDDNVFISRTLQEHGYVASPKQKQLWSLYTNVW